MTPIKLIFVLAIATIIICWDESECKCLAEFRVKTEMIGSYPKNKKLKHKLKLKSNRNQNPASVKVKKVKREIKKSTSHGAQFCARFS